LRVGLNRRQSTRECRDHLSVVCRVRRPRWRRAQLRLLDLPTMHGHDLGQRRLLRNQRDVPRPPTRDDPAASRAAPAIRLLVWLGGAKRGVLRRERAGRQETPAATGEAGRASCQRQPWADWRRNHGPDSRPDASWCSIGPCPASLYLPASQRIIGGGGGTPRGCLRTWASRQARGRARETCGRCT
jgi:hypothetical protein